MVQLHHVRRHQRSIAYACILGGVLAALLVLSDLAKADAIGDAARHYHLNADLLRAIAYRESHLNAKALHRNENGSVDIGLMQINSIHLPSLRQRGIDAHKLANARVNADVGASILRSHIKNYGATWLAVGEYHSHNRVLRSQYARAIYDIYVTRPWMRADRKPVSGENRETGTIVQGIAAD